MEYVGEEEIVVEEAEGDGMRLFLETPAIFGVGPRGGCVCEIAQCRGDRDVLLDTDGDAWICATSGGMGR